MFRIGILGSDNSHALNFSKMCNIPDENGVYRYEDVRIVAIHGHNDDPEHTKQVAEEGHIPQIVSSAEEMFGLVDAVMVVHRNGGYHVDEALPFIEKGMPVWIDKPLCTSLEDARRLRAALLKSGSPLAGGSSLRFCKAVATIREKLASGELGELAGGSISFPGDLSSQYAGLFFYGPHQIRVMQSIFGYDVQSVTAVSGDPTATSVIVRYPENRLVTLNFNNRCWTNNYVTVLGTENCLSLPLELDGIFAAEMDDFVRLLHEGTMSEQLDNMLSPSYVILAIQESLKQGREVTVPVDGFRLGLITDEATQDIDEAAALAKQYGADGLELRTVFGKPLLELTEDEVAHIVKTLEGNDLVCCGLSTPLFKCTFEEADGQLEQLDDYIRLAQQVGTRRLRGFAFWLTDASLDEVMPTIVEKLTAAAAKLRQAGMVLVLENEPTTYSTDAAAIARILQAVALPEIRALWDPGNDVYGATGEIPFPDGYEVLKPYIDHVHIKDAKRDDKDEAVGVCFGEGAVDFGGQLAALAADGYKGFCVLEPHFRAVPLSEEELKRPGGAAFSEGGMQASAASFEAIRGFFDEQGYSLKTKGAAN